MLARIRAGRSSRSLRDDPPAQGRQPAVDFADRVADSRRGRRDRRRLEDRPRHHRAACGCGSWRASTPTITEKLTEVGAVVASTLDRDTIVQKVTDTATELTRAEFGAFFYNVRDAESGDAYMLYTLSGAPQGGVRGVPAPARHGGVRADLPRRGDRAARRRDAGPALRPERAVPRHAARAPAGAQLPGGAGRGARRRRARRPVLRHSRAGVFTEQHERLAVGIAAWAAVALENARLLRRSPRRQPHEGRVPGGAVARAADAAQRHRRLRAAAARRHARRRQADARPRDPRAQRHVADADHRRRARRLAHRLRQDPPGRAAGATCRWSSTTRSRPCSRPPMPRACASQTIVDPGVGPVSGDPDRLQQVLWNLLSNAVKFTAAGGRVQVRLERVNSHVEVVVSDTGVGIAPEFLPHVFERFRQADAGTTRKTGGLGLGLAIVRHLVEMHGGTVEAASAGEDAGSTFRVRLPLMIVHPQKPAGAARAPAHGRPARRSGRSTTSRRARPRGRRRRGRARRCCAWCSRPPGAEVSTCASPAAALGRHGGGAAGRAHRRPRHAGDGRLRA